MSQNDAEVLGRNGNTHAIADRSVISPENSAAELKFLDCLDPAVNNPVPWLLEDLLAEREQMLIYGPPKVGKSQFVLQLAVALALGKPFLKWQNSGGQPRKVVYVNFEIDEHPFMNRLADHVLAEIGEEREDPKKPLDEKRMKMVDERIKNRLFFSAGIRSLGVTEEILKEVMGETNDGKGKSNQLVTRWQQRMRDLDPDIIIFDTLSKMHTVDEKDNSPIQKVMMLIRRLAIAADPEADEGDRPVAHIIVHHARKGADDYRGSNISLDSIRGGSAIRAEADVILGLKAGTSPEREPEVRRLVLEARNVAGDNATLRFDGRRFVMAADLSKEAREGQGHDKMLAKVFEAFAKAKVRAMGITELSKRAAGTKNHRVEQAKAMRAFLEGLLAEGEYIIKVCGRRKEEAMETSPGLSGAWNSSESIWIPDSSPWMTKSEMQEIMAAWNAERANRETVAAKRIKKRGRRAPG